MCVTICAQQLPSHFKGEGRRGGVTVNLVHERFVPHPYTPPLKWEGSGCAGKHATMLRTSIITKKAGPLKWRPA